MSVVTSLEALHEALRARSGLGRIHVRGVRAPGADLQGLALGRVCRGAGIELLTQYAADPPHPGQRLHRGLLVAETPRGRIGIRGQSGILGPGLDEQLGLARLKRPPANRPWRTGSG